MEIYPNAHKENHTEFDKLKEKAASMPVLPEQSTTSLSGPFGTRHGICG
ncbi:hypothetical protein RKD52_000939 [Metabacillus sp. SLBN-84]